MREARVPPHSSGMKCHTRVSPQMSWERRQGVRLDNPHGHVTCPAGLQRRAALGAAAEPVVPSEWWPLPLLLLLLGGTGCLGPIFLKNVAARHRASLGALALDAELAFGSSAFSFEVNAGERGHLGSSSLSPCLAVIPRRACGALRSLPHARRERRGRLPDRVVLRTLPGRENSGADPGRMCNPVGRVWLPGSPCALTFQGGSVRTAVGSAVFV